MLTVGDRFPTFSLTGVVSTDISQAFQPISNTSASGKWKVFFFYPKDFTFVCPTEITGFDDIYKDFQSRNCEVYGISTDSEFVHLAWRNDHVDLKNLNFPLLSDIKRDLSNQLGILDPKEGVCLRATFIVDPQDKIRHITINDLSVGRNPEEVLRVLDALQIGGLTPCNWKKGDETLKVA